jgi:hypothetical protein
MKKSVTRSRFEGRVEAEEEKAKQITLPQLREKERQLQRDKAKPARKAGGKEGFSNNTV